MHTNRTRRWTIVVRLLDRGALVERTQLLPAGASWHDARRCILGLRRLPAVITARIADPPRGGQVFVPAPVRPTAVC
jgi:hypothetical protein